MTNPPPAATEPLIPSEAGSPPLLQIDDLRTTFATARGDVRAVDGISFTLRSGECLGVVGESGSGKSVLVRTIMGLLPPTASVPKSSHIRWRGDDIRYMSPEEKLHLWGPELSMVFQDPMTSLNPVRKIGDQITDPLRYHLGRSRRAARQTAIELLGQVGIADPQRRIDQYPHELSGGMRQRVMIAIALSCEPKLLVADEPTTALDVTVQRQILELLRRLQRDHDMAMILISHDLGVVAGYTDRVAVMYAGRFAEVAPTPELFADMEHRYTSALLRSTPRVDFAPHTRLETIPGRPPDMSAPPPGCRFAPRCGFALDVCTKEQPPMIDIGRNHLVACHNPVSRDAVAGDLGSRDTVGV
jgi:peptide/nickel transport system ATP-binding protein